MKKQDVLIILVPTLIFVFAWIGFNIYHSAVTPTISEQQLTAITPIDPNFNIKTISLLQQRANVIPVFVNIAPANPTPTPVPSSSALNVGLSPTTQATTGGNVK